MKIVILDGYTANPGDLTWDKIEKHGELDVYDRSTSEETLERAADAEIIFTNKTILKKSILSQLKKVKYIGLLSTGVNVVDIQYCSDNKIAVTNIPAYSTSSVAQLTINFILELANSLNFHNQSVHAGEWEKCIDFSYRNKSLTELKDKTLGIIGYGDIGRKVAKIAEALGMNIIYYKRNREDDGTAEYKSLDDIFKLSDFLSLHCPLTDKTKNIINKNSISKMKDGAFLINTARGGLINEFDLADSIKSGKIGGIGLDVLNEEPPKNGSPLIGLKNCIITPHIGWATKESRGRLIDIAALNLEAFLNKRKKNRIV